MQRCLGEGEVPYVFYHGVLVTIPKDDKGGVRGISQLESVYKLISEIINLRMAHSVDFCEEVHGFNKKKEGLSL